MMSLKLTFTALIAFAMSGAGRRWTGQASCLPCTLACPQARFSRHCLLT